MRRCGAGHGQGGEGGPSVVSSVFVVGRVVVVVFVVVVVS